MSKHKPESTCTPAGFFALRTPLLPFDELLAWGDELQAAADQAEPARREEALAVDRARLRDRLRAIVTRPEVREALFVASPSLDERFAVWLESPESDKGQTVERTLVKYLMRMAGRATPFGLFAGCSVGTVGKGTRLAVPGPDRCQRHARLDMDYLVALAEVLERDPGLRKTLKYRPNSSLYGIPGRVRFHEYRGADKERTHRAVSVEDSDYLKAVLGRAAQGATIDELAAALVQCDAEASYDEAEQYIHELIDSQVLVSELSPAVTGLDPLHGLVLQLGQRADLGTVAERLGQVEKELEAIHAEPLGLEPQRYRSVAEVLSDLPAKVDPAKRFQVDMPMPLPDAFAVMASVAAATETALNKGDYQLLLSGVHGPSGARLLGRFCHADSVLQQHVAAHLRAEEAFHPDAVFAEIVHMPEHGRMGNVLLRPVLRDYEIAYLGTSGAAVDQQLPISDLLVTVAGDEIVLRSRRLQRRVIPRLTCAHNFHGLGKGLYRFLCLLQEQRAASVGWSWGPLQRAPFLPRVVFGKLVLSRARWVFDKEDLKALGETRGAERYHKVQEWRTRRGLPRWVVLADGDNELPADLENALSVETLVELIKRRDTAALIEFFPGPEQMCARGPSGRFVHELVVPFVRQATHKQDVSKQFTANDRLSFIADASSFARSFPPGSEWLYAKLYTGPALTDQLLRDVVRPVTESALQSAAADGWFFVRYGDPDWHLRLRYHGDPRRLLAEVFPALRSAAEPFIKDGRAWRFQLDTYEREVERYGGPASMALVEQIFQADSAAVLTLADILAEDARGDLRWRLTLRGMDALLDDLGFTTCSATGWKYPICSSVRSTTSRANSACGCGAHRNQPTNRAVGCW